MPRISPEVIPIRCGATFQKPAASSDVSMECHRLTNLENTVFISILLDDDIPRSNIIIKSRQRKELYGDKMIRIV